MQPDGRTKEQRHKGKKTLNEQIDKHTDGWTCDKHRHRPPYAYFHYRIFNDGSDGRRDKYTIHIHIVSENLASSHNEE